MSIRRADAHEVHVTVAIPITANELPVIGVGAKVPATRVVVRVSHEVPVALVHHRVSVCWADANEVHLAREFFLPLNGLLFGRLLLRLQLLRLRRTPLRCFFCSLRLLLSGLRSLLLLGSLRGLLSGLRLLLSGLGGLLLLLRCLLLAPELSSLL